MPSLQRRPAILGFGQDHGAWRSTKSDSALNRQAFIVGDHYESPRQEIDLFFAKLTSRSSNQKSRHDLSAAKVKPQDRYRFNEDDPGEGSEEDSEDEEPSKISTASERTVKFATAVPILPLGRPKLVDVPPSPTSSTRSSCDSHDSILRTIPKEIDPAAWLSRKTSDRPGIAWACSMGLTLPSASDM